MPRAAAESSGVRIRTGAPASAPAAAAMRASSRSRARKAARWFTSPEGASPQLAERGGGVAHAVGEAPLVVVPGQHAREPALDDLRLLDIEGGAGRVVVEVGGDQRLAREIEHALERAARRLLHGVINEFRA